MLCSAQLLSCVRLSATPWTAARQAPLSLGILRARIPEWVAMLSSTAFLGSPSPIIEEETEAQRREMICPRGRAGIEPRLVWPRSPGLQLLHTPVPQRAGLGRGPVPRRSQSAVRAPVREPINGCCAGAPHLSPCPGPPRGPALPGSFRHHSQL